MFSLQASIRQERQLKVEGKYIINRGGKIMKEVISLAEKYQDYFKIGVPISMFK